MLVKNLFLILCTTIFYETPRINAQLSEIFDDYSSSDEPACELCASATQECLEKQVEFFNYKLVKSIFNFGKSAIYHGLWVKRYEKADSSLFEKIMNETLKDYETSQVEGSETLGYLDFKTLNEIVRGFYENITDYSLGNVDISYDKYPSLKCPTPCTYDLITWQTLFGLSLAIFILAIITIAIYSIYLHRQYSILRSRLGKSVKYTKVHVSS